MNFYLLNFEAIHKNVDPICLSLTNCVPFHPLIPYLPVDLLILLHTCSSLLLHYQNRCKKSCTENTPVRNERCTDSAGARCWARRRNS